MMLLCSFILSGCNPLGQVTTADKSFLGGVSYSLSNSRVAVSTDSISAGSTNTITLTTRDNSDTVFFKSGLSIVFSVNGGVSGGTIGAVTDNGDGTYTAVFTGETAGTASNVEARINGELVSSAPPSITVIPGTVSAAHSTVSSSISSLNANGSDTSIIKVVLKDAYDNLVSGKSVSLSSDRGATDTIATISATTNSNGEATFSIKSLTVGNPILSARDSSDSLAITQTTSVSFGIGLVSATNSGITGTGSVVANGVATSIITITLKDVNNNPVSGVTPTFSATNTGSTNAYGACSATDTSGVSSCTLASEKTETKTLAITSPVSKSGGTVLFVAESAVAANSTITGTSSVVANGVATSTVTITLKDASNNPVASITPTFSATDTGSTNIYGVCSATSASGISTCAFVSRKAEIKTLTITNPINKSDGTVSFIAGTAVMANSTITGTGSVIANGTATSAVTITLKDVNNNSVTGVVPTFTATDMESTNAYGPCSVTDASGVSSCTLASSRVETKTLAITSPINKSDGTVSFIAGPISYSQSTFEISSNSLSAGNTATLALVLKDDLGNQIFDSTQAGSLSFSKVVGSGISTGTIEAITPVFGNAGAYQATFTGTIAGTEATIMASLSGVDFAPTAPLVRPKITVSAGTIDGAHSLLAASPSSNVIANGQATSTITITLKDVYDNPISGFDATTITVASSGSNNTIIQPSGTTDANGQTTATISSTTAETKTISLSAPLSLAATTTTSVTFVSGAISLAQSSVSSSRVSVAANNFATSTITVTLKDASGNALLGKSVTLTSSRGATDTITTSPATTNSSGEASFTVKSSTVGDATFTAVGDSQTMSQTPTILFLAATPYMDFQARFFDWINPGDNSSAVKSVWKDLASASAANNGALTNFEFTSTSGWTGDGTTSRSYTEEVMTDAPISYWKMDGNFNDSVGPNNGTDQNGATFGAAEYGSASGSFDGVDDYVSIPDKTEWDFGANNFTVEWWEYRTSRNNQEVAIARESNNGGYYGYILGHADGTNGRIYMSSTGSSWDIAQGKNLGVIPLNQWAHYAVTRNGNNFYTYQNGVQTDTWMSPASILASSAPLSIGKISAKTYNGLIDEVAIYNSALSSSRIAAHYAARAVSSSVGPSRLAFDGSNDYVDFGNGINGANSVSFETWIKPNASSTPGSVILSNGDTNGHGLTLKQSSIDVGKIELLLDEVLDYSSDVLADNPVSYWRMDNNWNDSKGTNHGSTTTPWITGKLNGALKFDGVNDQMNAGHPSLFNFGTGDFAFETWFKLESTANIPRFFATQTNTLQFGYNHPNWPNNLYIYTNTIGNYPIAAAINLDNWYHLVFTRRSGVAYWYLNGILLGSASYAGSLPNLSDLIFGLSVTGSQDEMRIYNVGLTNADVATLYNAGSGTETPAGGAVAGWHLNETTGATASDYVGSTDGTLANFSIGSSFSTAKSGTASGGFDGVDDFIELGNPANLQLNTGNFTLEAWVKPSVLGTDKSIIWRSNSYGIGLGFTGAGGVSNQLGCSVYNGGWYTANSGETASTTNWTHIACIFNDTENTLKIYINGALRDTKAVTINPAVSSYKVRIGNYNVPPDGGYYAGLVDEVAIYNTALSESRIQAHYNVGSGIMCLSRSSLSNELWHFISSSFDSATTTLKLFVNGTEECSYTNSGLVYQGSTNNLRAGTDASGANAWSGSIAYLRAYDSALSLSDLNANYTAALGGIGFNYIVTSGAGRRWSDGSYATSCKEYKTPSSAYVYAGTTGDGVYTIDPDGAGAGAPYDVYCDMTNNGGGWTLCGSFGDRKLGTTLQAGFNFISTNWNTAGTVFLNSSASVQSYGNTCTGLSFTKVIGQVRSGTSSSNVQFTTSPIMVSANPFSTTANAQYTTTGGAFATVARSSLGEGYNVGASCGNASNGHIHGSILCVGDNSSYFQSMIANVNEGSGPGDWMCAYGSICGTASQIILIYAK